MTRFQRLQEFQESTESTFLGIIPLAAVAQGQHETIVIGSIARYNDHVTIPVFLQMGQGHPEMEWRRRGRAGHPFINITMEDNLGTDYLMSPAGGGGGMYRYEFNQMAIPGIPDGATSVTLSLHDITWEIPWHEPNWQDNLPLPRWRIRTDLSDQRPATQMEELP